MIFNRKASPNQLQLMVWVFIFLINFLSLLAEDGFRQAIIYTLLSTFFYAVIIYGNIAFLFPRLYEKGRAFWYVLTTTIFLAGIGIARTILGVWVYNRYFAMKPEVLTIGMVIYITVTGLVIYILSFVFRIAIAYFRLKQQTEQMLEQKSLAELNLLKSQVQPHFLFNTLNNIYYEAFRESPRTALLIGRLSDIMRYFVEESPKEKVFLAAEVQFLENYIALEKIRIRHGVKVAFHKEYEGELLLPPMLLMTFAENIFKHGIDRSGSDNRVRLSLVQKDDALIFQTENEWQEMAPLTPAGPSPGPVMPASTRGVSPTRPESSAIPVSPRTISATRPESPAKEGSGLKNLEKRLTLLYGNRFGLDTGRTGSIFHAYLKIPLV